MSALAPGNDIDGGTLFATGERGIARDEENAQEGESFLDPVVSLCVDFGGSDGSGGGDGAAHAGSDRL